MFRSFESALRSAAATALMTAPDSRAVDDFLALQETIVTKLLKLEWCERSHHILMLCAGLDALGDGIALDRSEPRATVDLPARVALDYLLRHWPEATSWHPRMEMVS